MSKIGYARVSTPDQDLSVQIERLKQAGCSIIRSETASGGSRDGRGELDTILQFIHPDEELIVVRLDRLGRSARDVLNIVHEIEDRKASLRILEPEIISTSGSSGRMMIQMLSMVADMELSFIRERQKAGIEAAKARGVYKGGRKSISDDEIRRLFHDGMGKAAIARQLGIGRSSVYRALAASSEAAASGPAGPFDKGLQTVMGVLEKFVPSPPPRLAADEPQVEIIPPGSPLPSSEGPCSLRLNLSLDVRINRKGTRGRKRAIEEIESELKWLWDCALDPDDAIDGKYAIVARFHPDDGPDALDLAMEDLFETLGAIADERFCYIEARVNDPASGRSWSSIQPPKEYRKRRPPRRQKRPRRSLEW